MSVPALRFKEFQGNWNKQLLGDIFTFKNGINASKEQYGSGYKFINVLDIINNDFIYYENIIGSVNISEQEFIKNEVKYGDVLFQRSSETRDEVGQSNVYLGKQPVTFGGFVIRGRGIADYSPQFFNYILKTDSVRDEVTQRSGGSTRYNIGQDSLNVVPISLPPIDEQIKIGTFLKAIDEKIHFFTQKHELLAQYKKGVVQQIFSQELRFKDDGGQNFPEWEERKLADILVEFSERTTVSNQHRILSSTTKGLFNQDEYFTRDIASKDNAGYKIIRKNQLVFSPQNLWLGNININTDFEIGIVSPSYKIFGFNENLSTANYCKYFLLTPQMLIEYEQCSEQGASVVRRNLDMNLFLKINIPLPSLTEQTKIANFLSAIDDKITATQTQLQAVKQYKQGLLQQMFV